MKTPYSFGVSKNGFKSYGPKKKPNNSKHLIIKQLRFDQATNVRSLTDIPDL